MQTFDSLMNFSLWALLFDLSFQFVILYLLIPAFSQFHHLFFWLYSLLTSWRFLFNTWLYSHLINCFHCLYWFSSVWLFQDHSLDFLTVSFFYGDGLSPCHPTPNLEGQSTVFITLGAGWSSYTPRHWVPILSPFTTCIGLQWDCCFPQSPHRNFIPDIL